MQRRVALVVALSMLFGVFAPGVSVLRAQTRESKPIVSVLRPLVDEQVLAGAVVLAASKDEVLYLAAIGDADRQAHRPMQTNSLFWIASMSKPIAATAVMMMVDEGKVHIDDPVEKYLPEFKGQRVIAEKDADHVLLKRPKHPITIKNVLSHTSGLPFATLIEQPSRDLLPLRVTTLSYAMAPLEFEPDSKYLYSNAGINTAGRIVEVTSGMAYEEFLEQRLFKPLGMKDTTFWPSEEQIARLAKCYRPTADKKGLEEYELKPLKHPFTDRSRQAMPGGGLFSTAADCAVFCRMILGGGMLDGKRYLSEQAVQQMTSLQTGDLPNAYGLGWNVDKKDGAWCEHTGAACTTMRVDRKRQLVTVLMMQAQNMAKKDVERIHLTFRQAAEEAFAMK